MKTIGVWFLALGLAALPLAAQEKELVSTDRPGFGDGTAVMPPGGVQVELGGTYSDVEDTEAFNIGELNLRFGLIHRLELRASLNSYVDIDSPDISGITDSGVNLKYSLLGPDAGMELAVLAGTTLATGDDELTSDEEDLNAALSFGAPLSDQLSISAYAGWQDGDNETTTLSSSVGFGVGPAGVSVGYGGIFPDQGSDQHWLEANASFPLGRLSQFDINSGVGVGSDNSGFFVGAGFAHRF